MPKGLVGEQKKEGNHESEEAGGFSESETQNGIREQLGCNS